MSSIIALVGQEGAGVETVDEIMSGRDVVALSRRADQAKRQAERIAGSMDLGAQPAPRPTQALGIRPPLTLRAPAAC